MKAILMSVLFFLNFVFLSAENLLEKITAEDSPRIEIALTQLFKANAFLHTLYFDKPISFSEAFGERDTGDFLVEYLGIDGYVATVFYMQRFQSAHALKEAWEIFEKYQPLINHKKYLLAKKKMHDVNSIFLVNKDEFRKVVNKHIDLFKKIIGRDITADLLLSQFEETDSDLAKILNNSFYLFGILLGFGEESSRLFQTRVDLYDRYRSLDNVRDYWSKLKVDKKIDHIEDILRIEKDFECKHFMSLPSSVVFVSDPMNPEARMLKEKYTKQSSEVKEISYSDDWMKKVLRKLGE